jgi:uncharacterized membrane protein YkvA (DUF1232 family)
MKIVNDLLVLVAGGVSLVYLLNPGMGGLLEIPDFLPIIGNLDEAVATTLLISCLAYFGFDVTRIFRRSSGTDAKAGSYYVEAKSRNARD